MKDKEVCLFEQTDLLLSSMIGDAVPPQIGYAAGLAAIATLNMEELKSAS